MSVTALVKQIVDLPMDHTKRFVVWLWLDNATEPRVIPLNTLHEYYRGYELTLSKYHILSNSVAKNTTYQYVSVEGKKRTGLGKIIRYFSH